MEWIKCRDRLPEDNTRCICFVAGRWEGWYGVLIYENGRFHAKWDNPTKELDVIAWMPLPIYEG